jgi:hypothetical protein
MNTPTESPLVQRLRGYVATAKAIREGRQWQFYDMNTADWITSTVQDAARFVELVSIEKQLRPAPEPGTRAWTLETAPVDGVVWVRLATRKSLHLIDGWYPQQVHIADYGNVTYGDLRTDWLRADGSACGTTEESK